MKIKNWNKYQQYTTSPPQWIKLWRSLLDDIAYHNMPDKSAKYLPLIWIIASEEDGKLPAIEELSFRLRLRQDECEEILSDLSCYLENGVKEKIMPETKTERDQRLGLPKKQPKMPAPEPIKTINAFPTGEVEANPFDRFSNKAFSIYRQVTALFTDNQKPASVKARNDWLTKIEQSVDAGINENTIVEAVKLGVNAKGEKSLLSMDIALLSEEITTAKVGNKNKVSVYSTLDARINYNTIIDKWNVFAKAHGLSKIKDATDTIKAKLRKRLSEGFDIEEILVAAEGQEFLYSEWSMSFRWLIDNPDNYRKVLEKQYLRKYKKGKTPAYREENKKDHY